MARQAGSDLGGTPVSPPGKFSQRTDLSAQPAQQLPDAAYGEQAEFQAIQQAAPMAAKSKPVKMPGLMTPTARPDEPVTAGAPFGPGPSQVPQSTSLPSRGTLTATLRRMVAADTTGDSERLLQIAERLGW